MALVNNGWQRAEFLSITKTVGSNAPTTVDHDLKANFTANGRTHAAITIDELKVLQEYDYKVRARDFADYVLAQNASVYPGLGSIDSDGARRENLGACPL